MIPMDSVLEGKTIELSIMEDKLRQLGYSYGGGWEYDHGYFDYKIDDEDGYLYLRVPIKAVKKELDADGAIVQIGQPFMLHHMYQAGVDPGGNIGNITASFNQFQEPTDKDAEVDEKWLKFGERYVKQLDAALMPYV
ncbi:YugN-like family protein [Guptibacillus algicola]|uniref:YugN-like family protein n=1 Tax=Guptibacillus algicola TaxID=225844 RepID=UPI001CD49AA7|nr:YugN-like family protein [Alkalihalobacillus algicola]MCA0986583.1 YugN-like family protein [Alkalihalobacillus algicola]